MIASTVHFSETRPPPHTCEKSLILKVQEATRLIKDLGVHQNGGMKLISPLK